MRVPIVLGSVLCLLLVRFDGAVGGHDINFCQISQPTGIALPPAPSTYNVMMNIQDETNARTSAFEYVDGKSQRTSFQAYTPDGNYRAVLNFVTNQALVINMNGTGNLLESCSVETIKAADVLTPVQFGARIYYLPSKFFFGGSGINIEKRDPSEINGVKTFVYYSCYYWSSYDFSLKITWHFTQTVPIEPVRVVIDGKDNTNNRQFSLTHDISRFSVGGPGFAARFNPFMAPPGLYCKGLNSQGRKPQTLPDRFSMRIERIGLGDSSATYMREAYDFKSNMSLLVGYPPAGSGDSAKYGAGMLLYVHDFQRRLSYIRNEDMGNCTYERLSNADWDSQKDGNQLRIKTPREFFDLDTENVQYKGTGFTRDILTDIFINYKQIELGDTGIKFKTTIEWYFTNRTVVDPDTKTSFTLSVPLSVLISSEATWISSWMYIYDFETKEQIFNRHDISACFAKDAKKHFQVYFPLDDEKLQKYIRDKPNEFTNLLIPIIADGLVVSPLRVLDPEVTVRDSTAILELTVTDKPVVQADSEETPLREMEAAFDLLVKNGDVLTAVFVDGQPYVLTANKVTVIEERSNNLKSIGYSAGAVAGAAIGLLLAGLLAGLIAAFLFWR